MAFRNRNRGVAQSGSASALGAEGRRFESCLPDQFKISKNTRPGDPDRDFSSQWYSERASAQGLMVTDF